MELWAHQPGEITSLSSGSGSGSSGGMTNLTNATSCVASPSLPNGLNIDSSTCTISGTPIVTTSNATYTVTANISNTTFQTTVWLSTSPFATITSTVEGAHLNLGEAMGPITLNYTSQAGNGTLYNGNGTAWMVKDIYSGAAEGSPYFLTAVGNILYFRAIDGTNGYELWKSDGTASGTVLVKDINSGSDSGWPNHLTAVGNTLYFEATDGTNGYELWKSDGTAAGTVMVKDINSGSGSSDPTHLTAVGNTLYFAANDGTNGWELWKSDGTASGTVMVKDINSGSVQIVPSYLTAVGNTLYFSATDGTNGTELWKSDGTAAGTVMIKDINSGSSSSSPSYLTAFGNTLYFAASDGTNGTELWKSDGTASGTVMMDINSGSGNSYPNYFKAIGNTLYFKATDGTLLNMLWKSDGTANGTMMVGSSGSLPLIDSNSYLTAVGNTLYFRANDGTNGWELWKSDGTANGTMMVKDIRSGSDSSSPQYLTAVGNTVYFSAHGGSGVGTELFKSDGTANGTVMVQEISSGSSSDPSELITVDNILYFRATDIPNQPNVGSGKELWALDPANITLNTPPPVSWETDPALPAGMSISNGVISGTPSVYANNQTYTVYANQSNYSTTHQLYFSVDTDNAHTVVENQAIDAIGFHPPFNNGTTTWTASANLPANLLIDSSTGEITGTVISTFANATITVTATHNGSAVETFTFNLQSLADYDGDGLANDLPADYDAADQPTPGLVADDDDDADGLADSVETDTGTYIDATNTGTDPLNPDTDGDGICDGPNAVPPICVVGPDSDPNGESFPPTLVAVNNTVISTLAPYLAVSGGTYEIAPDLPATLSLDPATGEITGTATETITNTTYTMWSNNSNGDTMSWNFTIEILEDTDGDGLPNQLPGDYDSSNPDSPGLSEDLDDDGDGISDIDEQNDGTDSLNPDTDGDGMCDGEIPSTYFDPNCVAGPDAFPTDPSGDTDTDGDGDPDTLNPPSNSDPALVEDFDDDGDGIEDVNESNSGINNGPNDPGTDPLDPDTDGDGICDGPNDVYDKQGNLICIGGPDQTPLGEPASGVVYGLNNSQLSSLVPPYQLPDAAWEISPYLPQGLSIDPVSGIISGIPTEITGNISYTIYGNSSTSTITFDFNLQILEDTDRDGEPNELPIDYPETGELIEDLDDDGDGASDLSETGTGIYNGTGDMGTDPLDPDTDDDGICDGPNDVLPQCIGGPDSNPFGTGPLGPTVLVNNTMTTPLLPANAVPGAVWEISPQLPEGLTLDSSTGIITGTPTQTMGNKTFTMWANTTVPSMSILSTFWLEVLEDSDGDGMPDTLPEDYPDINPPYDLIEDLDDDNDGMSDIDEDLIGTDPVNPDTDGDGFCDGNGTGDGNCYAGPDSAPLDPLLPVNTDGDGFPDDDPDGEGGLIADDDDDNDGFLDTREMECESDPLDATDIPQDLDGDGICDAMDDDIDGDGLYNVIENDSGIYNSSIDTGTDPRNADTDGDGVCDGPSVPMNGGCTVGPDAFPLDPAAYTDTDGDGFPDELFGNSTSTPPLILDLDDDNDAWSDLDEFACLTDSLDDTSIPADTDGDGVCDALDDILDLPFNLTYPSQNLQLTINQEMDSFLANITGAGDVVTWEISGELPEGLTFGWSPARDAALDGSIRGTPTELMEMTNFTIWANNSAYSQSFEVSLTVIEEAISEDDDDDSGLGWMWCFPILILLLLLLLIPLILGRDKILLMLAEGPEPENTTASPEFLSGAGTEEDPFILEPIIDLEPGESASSMEIITIDKMSDIKIEMIDLHQESNGDKFSMYEEQFGTIGVRQLAIGKDGEVTINMKFDDGVDTPTFEGGEYSGLLKLGRASVYFSWSVTVKKDLSKKKKFEKAAKKAAKDAKAKDADAKATEEKSGEDKTIGKEKTTEEKVTEGKVAVVKDKIHSVLDRDGDGELTLSDVKTGAIQVGKNVKTGADKIKQTVVAAKGKTHEYLDKDGDGILTNTDFKIAVGRSDEKKATEEKEAKDKDADAKAKTAKDAKDAKDAKAKTAKDAKAKTAKDAKAKTAKDAKAKTAKDAKAKTAKDAKAKTAKDAKAKTAKDAKAKTAKDAKAKTAKDAKAKTAKDAKAKTAKDAKAKTAKDAKAKTAKDAKAKTAKDAKAKAAKDAKAAKAAEETEEKAAAKPVTKEAKKQELLERVKAKASEIDFGILGVASASEKDDLQTLKGIGPFIEEKLNALGIYTFKQISKMKGELEDQVNRAIEFFPGRVKRDQWVMQAKELLKK
ncbi:putative Ig domain-containing protein [Candidatus Poseidoniaceae archaeon]|nr:putative Ig domain-containing protein [Candidatus Poseidoniaceae archaeon]